MDSGDKWHFPRSIGVGLSTGVGDSLRVKCPKLWISPSDANLSTEKGWLIPRKQEGYPRGKIVVHRLCRGGDRAKIYSGK